MARKSKGLTYRNIVRMTEDERHMVECIRAEYDNAISFNDALRIAIHRGYSVGDRTRKRADIWVIDPDAAAARVREDARAARERDQQQ